MTITSTTNTTDTTTAIHQSPPIRVSTVVVVGTSGVIVMTSIVMGSEWWRSPHYQRYAEFSKGVVKYLEELRKAYWVYYMASVCQIQFFPSIMFLFRSLGMYNYSHRSSISMIEDMTYICASSCYHRQTGSLYLHPPFIAQGLFNLYASTVRPWNWSGRHWG